MVFNPRTYEPPDGSVTTAKIAANAVTTAKLADAAVTIAKSVVALGIGVVVDPYLDRGVACAGRPLEEGHDRERGRPDASRRRQKAVRARSIRENGVEQDQDASGHRERWDAGDLYTGAGQPGASAVTTSAVPELKELSVNMGVLANGLHVINLAAINSDATTQLNSDFRNYFVDPED